MALELPETFNWCTAGPTVSLGKEHLCSAKVFSTGAGRMGSGALIWNLSLVPGCLSWAMGLGLGEVLHNPPSITAFLFSSPAKEQYFIPGRRVGESRPA